MDSLYGRVRAIKDDMMELTGTRETRGEGLPMRRKTDMAWRWDDPDPKRPPAKRARRMRRCGRRRNARKSQYLSLRVPLPPHLQALHDLLSEMGLPIPTPSQCAAFVRDHCTKTTGSFGTLVTIPHPLLDAEPSPPHTVYRHGHPWIVPADKKE